MDSQKTQRLIFIALTCQLFASINFSFMNLYLKETQGYTDTFFATDQLNFTCWLLLTVFGRILGAYFIGKHADKLGFFKSILFTSQIFIFLSVLCAAFCLTNELSYELNRGFYFLRFFYSFLEPAALILPGLYLLNLNSNLNHYKISAFLIGAVFIAKAASYHLIYLPPAFMKILCIFPLIATSLSWIIYRHLKNNSSPEKIVISKKSPMPFQIKILCALFGAACSTGLFYHHFFVSYYFLNVNVMDARFDLGGVLYYTLCGLFLFPAAKLCEKFELYKTTCISLGMLFILGLNFVFSVPTPMMYLTQQILFSFFSALFIAPILAVLYRFYNTHRSIYDSMLWFVLGFSVCTMLAFFEQRIAFQKGFSGIGWCVYSASVFLCLIAIYKLRLDTIFAERSKVDSVGDIKLFEA